MEARAGEVLFREEQRFDRGWFWFVILTAGVPMGVIFGLGLWQQLGQGIPFGNNPVSDLGLIALAVSFLVITGAVAWLLLAARLITEVRPGLLFLHYRPLRRKTIPTAEIARAAVRQYRPIAEYGGWGIRCASGAGGAWNVSGDRGVQLELEGGAKFFVGSQRAEDLKAALDRAR